MIQACPLFSGSSGNSVYLSDGFTSILVDAGQCCRTIENSLTSIDVMPASLSAVLVTHEHIDHIRGVGVLMRRYGLPVYANKATWDAMRRNKSLGKLNPDLIRILPTGEETLLGDLRILPVRTPHDAADPVGYKISNGKREIGVFTDLGYADPALLKTLSSSDLLFLEANYDRDMLYGGPYPWPLKKRIDGDHGHLCNTDSATAAYTLLQGGVTRFVLSHLSQENNTPQLAGDTVESELRNYGAVSGQDYQLSVAPRHRPGSVWEL